MQKASHVGIEELDTALDDLRDRFPRLKVDDLFVLWFLRAYITESEDKAADAISGGARDKGIDALLIDDEMRSISIVQGKYHASIGSTAEKRSDIVGFAEIPHRLCEKNEKEFEHYLRRANPLAAGRLREARQKVARDNYRVWMYFVSLGKVSLDHRKDAESMVKKAAEDITLDFIDGRRAMLLLRDYLDGVAPPIPTLYLEMEQGPHVRVNGISQRYDHQNQIESWVFSMRGDAVATLFRQAGVRLFARNIRGFLGHNTPINKGMVATLNSEPDRFFYYNNGITILCDDAKKESSKGKDILRVSNPQVINGQQTTRTLAGNIELAGNATVLVKVIQVSREHNQPNLEFDKLLSSIVQGTNWQNPIRPSDLMANDRVQIDLERVLRKLGYCYIRKRQTKGEMQSIIGGKQYTFVKKEEFAQAVAACDIDPVIARTARERLFGEEFYNRVFPCTDPDYYLPRYWVSAEVQSYVRGDPQLRETRWLALHIMWTHLSPKLKGAALARSFHVKCQKQQKEVVVPLSEAISIVCQSAMSFYRANRGTGEERVDPATFFKSKRASASAFRQH